jgi:hypothetical protein
MNAPSSSWTSRAVSHAGSGRLEMDSFSVANHHQCSKMLLCVVVIIRNTSLSTKNESFHLKRFFFLKRATRIETFPAIDAPFRMVIMSNFDSGSRKKARLTRSLPRRSRTTSAGKQCRQCALSAMRISPVLWHSRAAVDKSHPAVAKSRPTISQSPL